jgi:all-trans-retinol 13,14-reductase
MLKVAKSVETILPHVYQAGQWVYSPSGLPISILTGKLAADRALKDL